MVEPASHGCSSYAAAMPWHRTVVNFLVFRDLSKIGRLSDELQDASVVTNCNADVSAGAKNSIVATAPAPTDPVNPKDAPWRRAICRECGRPRPYPFAFSD